MSRNWPQGEQRHVYITETHLRIGEGGRGWGAETKSDIISGQSTEAQNNKKVHSKRTKLFLIKNTD